MELPKPKYGATLLPTMQYLQAPGMRGLRSPSRESITSDFSVMSMSSRLGGVEGSQRRQRLQYMSKSRETLNSARFDQMSLNVSVDIPSVMQRQPNEEFLLPGQNAFVRPHNGVTKSFSFSDIRSAPLDQDDALREGPAAVSDPSLSVNSDFDDEISMFFDDKGEPINFHERSGAAERISAVACDEAELIANGGDDGVLVVPTAIAPGKRGSKLRHRIKRKFLNFSFNELIRRRRSSKKSASGSVNADGDRTSLASGSPSPKPEKRIHINVFPEPENMKTLTDRDIEREQGKALSKYSRNLMIFNWLHNTEETWFSSQMQ